ncbi:hypothetical protein C6501_02065 [Candidatus Poribacteria bacterium]|nr:MAG: hypothetical protein C6501_02065 [Candidatus Poribacteria bacterium]
MDNSEMDIFFYFADQPDSEVGLAIGALLIAQSEYPNVDIDDYLQKLGEMADEVRERISETSPPHEQIAEYNRYFFTENRFKREIVGFYDPANNYLNDVIDRRIGIDVTLYVLYIEIGRKAGLPLSAVNVPFQCIVKYKFKHFDIFLDLGDEGRIISEEALRVKLEIAYGDEADLQRRSLNEDANKETLARILRNLARIYTDENEYDKAIQALKRITWLTPRYMTPYRRLGHLFYQIGNYNEALTAYETYLDGTEIPFNEEQVIENIRMLRRILAKMN